MLRQYHAPRRQGGDNPLGVGTIALGAVFYLQDDGHWRVAAAIPAQKLSDGVQTFLLLEDAGEGAEPPLATARHLASLSLVAGAPLEQDLRAEIDLMRSELDLVKRELRRVAARQDQARQDQAQPDQ